MTPSYFTLSDLERSNARSLRFRCLISCTGAELGHALLLNSNRKAYAGMESRMTSSNMTFSDLKRTSSRSLRFRSLISCTGAELSNMLLLLNINRKAYMGSPTTLSRWALSELERSG